MANYTRTALKGAVMFFMMSFVAGFIGYIIRFILARNLTKFDYGLFYAVFTFFAMLSLFRDMGLGSALVKFIAEFNIHRKYSKIKGSIVMTFFAQLFVSLAICTIILIFSQAISLHFFHTADAFIALLLLSIMFILMPIEKAFGFAFQGFQRIDFNSLIEFVRGIITLAFILLAFRYDVSIIVPCAAYIAAYALENLILAPLFLRTFPRFFIVKAEISKDLFRQLFLFGLPIMIGLFGSMIVTYTDTLAITYFRTMEEVALYQVAMPISKLLLYFTTAITMVVLPMTSELWARKFHDKLYLGINLLYKYSFVLIMPAALLMFSFPELIIKVFFGSDYVAASRVLQILSLAGIIYTICYINSNILSGIGRPKENTKIILIAAVFNLAGDIILVPFIGITGAAIATFLSYCIMLVMTGLKIRSILKVRLPWMSWLKNAIAGAVFVAVIYCLKDTISIFGDMTEMMIVGIAGLAAYTLLLFMFRIVDFKEITGIAKYALKK